MVILALETVTRAGSLAILADETVVAASIGEAARSHSVRLPGDLHALLRTADLSFAAIDGFAVVSGPGSFTGLRIGIATIQGVALATGRQVVPVPTMDALAWGWIDEGGRDADVIVTCLEASRGETFYAVFEAAEAPAAGGLRPAVEPRAASADVLVADVIRVRPGGRVAIIGEVGAGLAVALSARLPAARIVARAPHLAAAAARLARRRFATAVAPHALRPVYGRRPDAEVARDRAAELSIFEVSTGDDLTAVAELQARSFTEAWGTEALALSAAPGVARLYAARDRTLGIVAYCAAWRIADELHINSLAVDPRVRRRGVAKALLARVLQVAVAEGAAAATLEVRPSNHPGRALYAALGFKVEGVRRDYYQHPREDALILWRRGPHGPAAG
jgi:tRNA threonylcarbamoyl adenosine modification protein YeaZ/ribosomal-protein-alanine acetyltransferase